MARINLLTARQVNTLKEGSHSDGGNLYLRVRSANSRAWVFRYKINGKVTELGLGSVVSRTLIQVRELAGKMRNALANGNDPADLIRVKREPVAKTFKENALELLESLRSGWRSKKHEQQWENTLEQYAFPSIGDKLPVNITLPDIKAILLPIWATKTSTATRLRQRIESVLDYAYVHEDIDKKNPARWKGNLDKVLPEARKVSKREHHAAAAYTDIPRIMSILRTKDYLSAYCLRFIILTATRNGESRGALWDEINMDERIWIIPPHRMKAEREHRVPLNDEAMEILTKMQEWRMGESMRVFSSIGDGLLSDVAVSKTLHTIDAHITTHGMRSSFRQWGAETTSFPSAALELSLAHAAYSDVEAAYQRSDLFDRRRELMKAWGSYCGEVGNVIQIAQTHQQ